MPLADITLFYAAEAARARDGDVHAATRLTYGKTDWQFVALSRDRGVVRCGVERFLFTTSRSRSTVRHVRSDGSLSVERLARSALRLLHVLKPLTLRWLCH